MSQYRSSVLTVISKYTDVALMLVLIALSLALRYLSTTKTAVVITLALAFILNVLVVKARTILCSYYIQVPIILLIFYNVTMFLGMLHFYELSLDLILIIMLLVILTLYWHYVDISSLFAKPLLPVSILVAGFTGVYIGVSSVVRYLLLTVLDALFSLALVKSLSDETSMLIRGFLFFLCIYCIPGLRLTQLSLLAFAILHLIRNMTLLDRTWRALRGRVLEFLCIDILLKPFLVVYA